MIITSISNAPQASSISRISPATHGSVMNAAAGTLRYLCGVAQEPWLAVTRCAEFRGQKSALYVAMADWRPKRWLSNLVRAS